MRLRRSPHDGDDDEVLSILNQLFLYVFNFACETFNFIARNVVFNCGYSFTALKVYVSFILIATTIYEVQMGWVCKEGRGEIKLCNNNHRAQYGRVTSVCGQTTGDEQNVCWIRLVHPNDRRDKLTVYGSRWNDLLASRLEDAE